VEIVRTMLERFSGGDYEAALATIHPEVVWEDPGLVPGRGIHHGHHGLSKWFSRWLGAWDNFVSEPVELIDAGNQVVVIERMRGRGRQSGVAVDRTVISRYVVRDGQVVERIDHSSRDEALEAAGLSE